MPIIIDPQTRQRHVVDQFTTDIIYNKRGDTTLSQEDVPFIGQYKDFTGSKIITSKERMDGIRIPNQFQGQDVNIEKGVKLGNLTNRGNNADVLRTRTKKVRVEITKSDRIVYLNK